MPVTLQGALTIIHGGITAGVSVLIEGELDATGKKVALTQALSTALADLNIGAITWTDGTWLQLSNLSTTLGEDATITKRIGVGSLSLQGTVAGTAVPATAAGGAGFYYEIIAPAGVSQGKTWAIGDWAIYSGTSGTWFLITPNVLVGLLKHGEVLGPIKVAGDGVPFRAKSAAGTPTVQVVMAGPLA